VGLATAIRTKMYGKDVREAIASAIEMVGMPGVDSYFTPKGVLADLATLESAYPTGTDGIWITQDDGYWNFWDGTVWKKGSVYQSSGIPTSLLEQLKSINHTRNYLKNADLATDDLTGWGTGGAITATIDKDFNDNNTLSISNSGLTADSWGILSSDPVSCYPGLKVSFRAITKYANTDSSNNSAIIGVNFFGTSDGTGDRIGFTTQNVEQTENYVTTRLDNINVPANASTMRFFIQLERNGNLHVYKPILTKYRVAEAVDPELTDSMKENDTRNMILDPSFDHLDGYWRVSPAATVSSTSFFENHRALSFETHNNTSDQYVMLATAPVKVYSGAKISASVLAMSTEDTSTDGFFFLVNFYSTRDCSGTRLGYEAKHLTGSTDGYRLISLQNLTVPENAQSAEFMFQIVRNGTLTICEPIMTNSPAILPFQIDKIKMNSNLVSDPEFNNDPEWYYPSTYVLDKSIDKSHNAITFSESGLTASSYQTLSTRRISIGDSKYVSASVDLSFIPETELVDTVIISLDEFSDFDQGTGRTNYTPKILAGTWNRFHKIALNNIKIQDSTQYVSLSVQLVLNGTVSAANFEIKGSKDIFIKNANSRNLIFSNDLEDLTGSFDNNKGNFSVRYIEDSNNRGNTLGIFNSGQSAAQYGQYRFPLFRITKGIGYSAKLDVYTELPESTDQVLVVVDYFDSSLNRINYDEVEISDTADWKTYFLDNLLPPDDAVFGQLHIELEKNGLALFNKPLISESEHSFPTKVDDFASVAKPNGLPRVYLIGDTSAMTHDKSVSMKIEFLNGNQRFTGYSKTKWQGDSSLQWDKKNYRINLYSDSGLSTVMPVQLKPDWLSDSKFNLKANYTDGLLARNNVNAKIAAAIYSNEPGLPEELVLSQNFGQIDGFPVELFINNNFHGIYTFNTAKSTYGNAKIAVAGDEYVAATLFSANTAKYDGTDFEFLQDSPTTDDQAAFNAVLKFVNESSDTDFVKDIDNYISVSSAINYMIFGNIVNLIDNWGKNADYISYDGTKFYCIPYDLDCSYGGTWNGALNSKLSAVGFNATEGTNKLFSRINDLMNSQVKDKYTELRKWLTPMYVLDKYRGFIQEIGRANYEREFKLWNNPSKDTYTFSQLTEYVYNQFKVCDAAWLQS
jgi:hypothetical protein